MNGDETGGDKRATLKEKAKAFLIANRGKILMASAVTAWILGASGVKVI